MQDWEEELMATITAGTTEWLLEQAADAEIVINRKPLYSYQIASRGWLTRKEQYRDYQDRLLAEIAARG